MRRTPLPCSLCVTVMLVLGDRIAAAAADLTTTAPATTQSAVDAALNPIIPLVDFNATTLEKAIDALREKSGVNIVSRWHRIEAAGVNREAPITLRVVNLPLQRVLLLLGEIAGDGSATLAVRADRGVVIVSNAEDLRPTALRLYDVRDLVESDAATYRHIGGAAAAPTTEPTPQPVVARVTDSLERLEHLIKETIEPESWRDAGGTDGSVFEFNGKLVISQTPAAHKRIAELLEMLRKK